MKSFDISHVPISGKPMVRDMHSKAIISTDVDGLRAYKDKVAQMEILKSNQNRLDGLEDVVGEIKDLLHQLLSRNS